MKRTILVGLAVVTLVMFGCQSGEERQAQELREALLEIVDEVEELKREQIAVLEQQKQTVATLPPPNFLKGWGWPSKKGVQSEIESAEKQLKERPREVRAQIEEYADLELPGLAKAIRALRVIAKGSLETEQNQLVRIRESAEKYRQAQKAAEEEAAAKKRAAAERKRSARKAAVAAPAKQRPQKAVAAAPPAKENAPPGVSTSKASRRNSGRVGEAN